MNGLARIAAFLAIVQPGVALGQRPVPSAGQESSQSEGTNPSALSPADWKPLAELGPGEASGAVDLWAKPGKPSGTTCEDTSRCTRDEDDLLLHVRLRGRIHADAIFVNQSARDRAIIGDLENAVGFRRARLGAQGTVGEQVRWVAEFDFAGGDIAFKDIYLAVEQLPLVRQVRVGHFSEPLSLEGEISSNGMTFIERSPVYALDPDRNWGVGIYTYTENERATLAMGAFRSGTGDNGNDIGDENDMAYTVRVTGLPWYDAASEGRKLMHIGAAFSQRFPKNDVVTFNQGPQSSLLQSGSDNTLTPFVPNISIPATQNQLYNVQWATVLGSLSFQAEWSATTIDQIGGGPVFLHGSYAYVSFFLTGEHREYDRKEGVFGLTRVRSPFLCLRGKHNVGNGPGAWELAGRFAYLNFSDSNIPLTANGLQQGDRLTETTLGVNWYLNDHARIMFNYSHAIPVDPNFGPSAGDGFFLRSEIFW